MTGVRLSFTLRLGLVHYSVHLADLRDGGLPE